MERKVKKFIIEVEEGRTKCDNCFAEECGNCSFPYRLHRVIDCDKYDLSTMKIKELEEEK